MGADEQEASDGLAINSMATVRPQGPVRAEEGGSGRYPVSSGLVADSPGSSQFRQALLDAGLVSADQLDRLAAGAPGKVADDASLTRALIRSGVLTPYQAAAVRQGKTKGLMIGAYVILDKLGEGGMGVVFKARHRQLNRIVALKILTPSLGREPDLIQRFRREVDAVARLAHPNVIAAIDAAEDRGVHYLAMQYVDGRDLEKVVTERGPLPVGQALDCLIQAARGLDAAHKAGVIHRDIKPSNLMLDRSGTVRVLDLGLARITSSGRTPGATVGRTLTQPNCYMGTVEFCAPEQAEDSRSVDGRADIYSLACTLHYLLTSCPPFGWTSSSLKTLIAHQQQPAPPLHKTRNDVPEALERVYQRMMSKRPASRPATMGEVVQLLEECRLAPEASAAGAGLRIFAEQAVPSRDEAPSDSSASDWDVLVDLQDKSTQVTEDPTAHRSAEPVTPPTLLSTPGGKRSPRRFRALRRRPVGGTQRARVPGGLIGGVGVVGVLLLVIAVSLRPSGPPPRSDADTKAASPGGTAPVTQVNAPALPPVVELPAPEPLVHLGIVAPTTAAVIQGLAVAPDKQTLLAAGEDGQVHQFEISSGRELRVLWHPGAVRAVAWLPNGLQALTSSGDGSVRLWDLRTGRVVRQFAGTTAPVAPLVVAPDGSRFATVTEDRTLVVYETSTGGAGYSVGGLAAPVTALASGSDGRRLLVGDAQGSLHLANWTTGDVHSWQAHADRISALAVAPDGRTALSGGGDGAAIVWDLDAASPLRRHEAGGSVRAVRFELGSERARIATQTDGQQGRLIVWDLAADSVREAVAGRVHTVLSDLPGGALATADTDNVIRLWLPSRDLARARDLSRQGQGGEALAAYDRAVQAHPNDARLRIERGRLRLAAGRGAEADADFDQAAQVTADFLPIFLEAGWWVAGPYPPANPGAVNPIATPDPGQPPPSPSSGAAAWQPVETGPRGLVALRPATSAERATTYALTVVYSRAGQADRTALMASAPDEVEVWAGATAQPFVTVPRAANPVTKTIAWSVPAGRTVIVARAAGVGFRLQATESPASLVQAGVTATAPDWSGVARHFEAAVARDPSTLHADLLHHGGRAFAELRQWQRACGAFDRAIGLTTRDVVRAQWLGDLALAHLALGDVNAFRTHASAALAGLVALKNPDPATTHHVLGLAAVVPRSPDLPAALELARGAADHTKGAIEQRSLGSLLYRIDSTNSIEAERHLIQSTHSQNDAGNTQAWLFRALTEHHLNRPDARKSLDRARELAKSVPTWQGRVEVDRLLAEVESQITRPHHTRP